jgi:hypothetical protein
VRATPFDWALHEYLPAAEANGTLVDLNQAATDPAARALEPVPQGRDRGAGHERLRVGPERHVKVGSVPGTACKSSAARARALNDRYGAVYHTLNLGVAEYLGGSPDAAEALSSRGGRGLGRAHRAGVSLAQSGHLPRPGEAGPYGRSGSAALSDTTGSVRKRAGSRADYHR